ncbi:MAG: tetratricopeptide repeat protein [Puniceicoccales bacterium]|jgi:type III secretion system low calcium response chaperone LcrH/SycD|nr:tetratricopeptide repeat protein [Puniceicoccales bacterium]
MITTNEETDTKEAPPQTNETDAELEQLTQEISAAVAQGKITLGEALAIPKDKLEIMYATAYNLYNNDKYEKASTIFNVLCLYEPGNLDYWIGLGACQKLLNRYEGALISYHTILTLNPTYFTGYLELAECLFKLEQLPAAKKVIEAMLELAKNTDLVPSNETNGRALSKAQAMAKTLESVS